MKNFVGNIDRAIVLAERGHLRFIVPPTFPWSPGHYLHDLHMALLYIYETDPSGERIYILPFHEAEIPAIIISLIADAINEWLPNLYIFMDNKYVAEVNHMALLAPELCISTNSAICRLILPPDIPKSAYRVGSQVMGLRHYSVSPYYEQMWIARYIELAQKFPHLNPFTKIGDKLEKHLPKVLTSSRYVVIQAKNERANVGLPMEIEDYKETLEFIRDSNYKVVIGGREDHKSKKYLEDAYHYGQSTDACFLRDFALYYYAEVSLIGGSGISIIPALLNKPFVYNNHATFSFPSAFAKCVSIPALTFSKTKDRYLSISEVEQLWLSLPSSWQVKPDKYSSSTRHGNPYSTLFDNEDLIADTRESNRYLVESIVYALTDNIECKEISSLTRSPGSAVGYCKGFVNHLRKSSVMA